MDSEPVDPTPYEAVPYPGDAFPQTHPDRLATLATLFGLQPPPVTACRVLELGCGQGTNLLSMAYSLPESEFIGVDLAAGPLEKGRRTAEAIGLKNVSLLAQDIRDLSNLGQFDYIIAHGVYSWVPGSVRESILAVCRESLAPQGVAYISYNAYPGSHFRDLARGMMTYHVRAVSEPLARVRESREFLRFLSEADTKEDLYRAVLREEWKRIQETPNAVVYHDDLEKTSQPFYFYEFVEQANHHSLKYLSEAQLSDRCGLQLKADVIEDLDRLAGGEWLAREQYLDFLTCRKFRQTLLCHQEAALHPEPSSESVRKLGIASALQPVSPSVRRDSFDEEEFRSPKGSNIFLSHPVAKAAYAYLAEIWPQPIQFEELLERSRAETGPTEDEAEILSEILLRTYEAGLIELHSYLPSFVIQPGERPVASRLARHQAVEGVIVNNLRQETIRLDDLAGRQLLQLLDGTRDRPTLRINLQAFLESHPSARSQKNRPQITLEALDLNLHKFARLALLVA